MNRLKLPRAAGQRPVVRVVLPAGPLTRHESDFYAGLSKLEAYGCEVRWDDSRVDDDWRGYLSGPDFKRLEEVCSAFTEPDVDIVWCGRGGSGCNRIADPLLQYAKTLTVPKCLIGFSDVTALLNPLCQTLGWVAFHGPVITSLAKGDINTDIDEILNVLRGEQTELILPVPFQRPALRGRLLGGNLTVLASMIGTPTAPRPAADTIWLLEDVGESPYRIDRAFDQLKRAGLFKDACAIWLGDLGLPDQESEMQMAAQIREDAPCPVLLNAPAGHRANLSPLPLGATVELCRGRLRAQHPWVAR
ncbi:MAG: LD-carboxypeptidase [Myxococcota bacterium]|nr:LD-carboxypeptidase [Myxococcota bacterium]